MNKANKYLEIVWINIYIMYILYVLSNTQKLLKVFNQNYIINSFSKII